MMAALIQRNNYVMRVNILALCGSLRSKWINAALLNAAAVLAPSEMTVSLLQRLGQFPLFNPDAEYPSPAPVHRSVDCS
jgi:NAD(P)H-dependent FMN reductase